jgi:hypothetical protein
VRTGDRLRVDLGKRTADIVVSDEELEARRAELMQAGGYAYSESQTPWQEIQRDLADELSTAWCWNPQPSISASPTRRLAQAQPPTGRRPDARCSRVARTCLRPAWISARIDLR